DCTLQPHNAAAGFPRSLTFVRNAPRFPAKNPRARGSFKGRWQFRHAFQPAQHPYPSPATTRHPECGAGLFFVFPIIFHRKFVLSENKSHLCIVIDTEQQKTR
ncbi:MAG: hypothetical protein PUI63_02395, partial [Alistipes senegalensis]|uniref:hypothetical protein n=1 Tax=Alistipes senegalensis TaxID=1288121 RepID=UPI00242A3756